MDIGIIQIIQGTLSLIYVAITIVLSVIFISKYLKLAMPELLLIGLALIGMAGPWFPEALGFLVIVLTG